MMANALQWIDSHAHLTDSTFTAVDSLLQRAQHAGVRSVINICTSISTLNAGLELAKNYPWIYNAAATPPHDVEKEGEIVFAVIARHARKGHLVAIGETGLDYHYYASSSAIQKDFLRRYFHLALECKLPVVIHCRNAFKDFFEILDKEYKSSNGKHHPGVLHCFTGTIEEAEQVIERGWYLSISGILTFKNSEELRQIVKRIPLEKLLIETDAPYLAPQSRRGKINEPAYIVETAQTIAQLKDISLKELADQTVRNACELFKIKI
ncbi:putative deoxyribonuclease YabD [Neochlamydia sp. EPS4]|nr:putative deoxyribonuclease YabD [Neochlamydia sp. EPS4]